jgi:aminoglycoside 6'-N-acetyltransferase
MLIDRDMSKKQLEIKARLSSSTIAKMNKSYGVTTNTLERICKVLDCKIEDVVEIVPDEDSDMLFSDDELSVRCLRDDREDRSLLLEWLTDPNGVTTVAWKEDVPWDMKKIERKFMPRTKDDSIVTSCIINQEEKAIGYIQFYPLDKDSYLFTPPIEYEKFKGGYGIDLFIGYPELWDQGIGTKAVRAMADYLINNRGAKVVCADPEENNHRSVACWKRAGFVPVGKILNIDDPGKGKISMLMVYSDNQKLMEEWRTQSECD